MKQLIWTMALALAVTLPAQAQDRYEGPVIDMHLHAYNIDADFDLTLFPWLPSDIETPTSSDQLLAETLDQLEHLNVVKGWASGPVDVALRWKAAAPDTIMPAPDFLSRSSFIALEDLTPLYESGKLEGLGELVAQIDGLTPSDEFFEPYLEMAEELEIPVAFHTGLPLPGVAYFWNPKSRASLGSPLGVEEALLRHPNLRVYIMHAGYPFLDETIALLHAHPQVYVDIGEIDWIIPPEEFHYYLQRLVQAGFAKRLMFGSDQMWWPQSIGLAIEAVQTADFLSVEQKADILYNNAARFLRLTGEEIARHHKMVRAAKGD